jgi:hypothetical protein
VYSFVANGLYGWAGPKLQSNTPVMPAPALRTLFKTISYFKSYKLIVLGDDATVATEAIRLAGEKINAQIWFCSPFAPVPGGADLIIITGKNEAALLPLFERAVQDINNKTVLAVANIHASPQMEAAWEAIKKDPRTTVTVDTYNLGLVFFRREQQNQHFTIRTKTSLLVNAVVGIRNLWGLLG